MEYTLSPPINPAQTETWALAWYILAYANTEGSSYSIKYRAFQPVNTSMFNPYFPSIAHPISEQRMQRNKVERLYEGDILILSWLDDDLEPKANF